MQIYNRADIVNFMNTGTTEEPVFTRMQGFTAEGTSMNSSTYSRRYVDERVEREDVTGFGTAIGDGTDAYQYSGNFKAAGKITKGTASISADELTATFTPDSASL